MGIKQENKARRKKMNPDVLRMLAITKSAKETFFSRFNFYPTIATQKLKILNHLLKRQYSLVKNKEIKAN